MKAECPVCLKTIPVMGAEFNCPSCGTRLRAQYQVVGIQFDFWDFIIAALPTAAAELAIYAVTQPPPPPPPPEWKKKVVIAGVAIPGRVRLLIGASTYLASLLAIAIAKGRVTV